MARDKQKYISVLLVLSILLYLYGYNICHLLYNQYDYVGEEKKQVAKSFWNLRFGLYSVIITVVYYVSKFNLSEVNKSIENVGFNLAITSSIDKIVLNNYMFSKYDIYIIVTIVLFEIIQYQLKKIWI